MTEVFILKFNGATKLAYCFSREELKLYKVRINKHDSRVKPPMKFKLKVVSTDESDVVSPDNDLLGQTLNITERGDGVSMARNEIRLKAYIMFSEDPNHHTYNKEIAFSDWYGYINCVALENRNSLERGKVYKAEVFINDLSNENRLFAIRNRPLPTVNPEEIPQVLAKLNTYENRHRHVNLDEQAKKRAQRRVEFASENECFWVGDVVQNSEPNLEKRDEQVLETVQEHNLKTSTNFTSLPTVQVPLLQLPRFDYPLQTRTTMSSDKKQIELTVLVLDIENKREFGGVVVTGYSRSFLELVRIFVEENTLVSIGQNLYYIKEGLNDGIVYPQAGSVRAANVEDVKLSSGRIYVPVSVAIHNATTAFSEFYGFIDIYNYERKEWLEEIYNTTITVRQTTDENLPIFEASEKLIPCPNMDPKDKKRIIEELKKFEVKMRINNRPTNMGRPGFETSFRERDVPSVSTRRRQNYEPRKRSYEEIRKIVKKQYYNCLVVSRFTNDKSFGIVHTKFGAATMLEVNDHGPNSQDLDVGDWCSASLDVQKSGRLSMTKVNCRDSIGRNAHVVENGIIYLFEEIDLRDNGMKNFRGSNSHFVIERTNNDLLRNILVPAKFQKFDGLRFEAKIKYVLEARDDLCWEIVEVIGEIPDKVSYTSWVQSTPDLHPHLNGIPLNTPERLVHHPDEVEIINDSSDDEPASANDLKKEYSDMKEDKNPGRTPPWQEKGFYKYEQNPMNMEYRPESQTSRSSRNPQDIGFFANKLKSGDFILFSDKLKASVYCSKIVASNAHLGDLRYIETMPLSQIFNGCYYQAEFVAHHGPELSSDVKIIGDSAQYLAVVNLRDPLKLSRLGFPLYESDVGKVMLTLRTTLEFYEEQDYRHFLKDFHGKPGSDKMACWCSFDYAEVPLVCVDRNCYPDDPQVVQAFHWRVSHICGTMHAYSIQEKAMKDRNLHENRKTYEEYDDIARQKELNRRNGAYAGNAGGSGMNDYMSGRSSYSSVRPDSSASNVPPNAHFPPPNVPVPHLPNPGFNESFNVPLSQGYSNTSDHYSHSGRGGPQPPYSNDYPSTRQTSSNMNDSRTPTQHSPVDNRALQDEINELKIALGKCRVELKNATKIVGAIGDDNEIRACMKSNNYDLYDTCERFLNKIYIENPTWRPVSSKSSANGSNRH